MNSEVELAMEYVRGEIRTIEAMPHIIDGKDYPVHLGLRLETFAGGTKPPQCEVITLKRREATSVVDLLLIPTTLRDGSEKGVISNVEILIERLRSNNVRALNDSDWFQHVGVPKVGKE